MVQICQIVFLKSKNRQNKIILETYQLDWAFQITQLMPAVIDVALIYL